MKASYWGLCYVWFHFTAKYYVSTIEEGVERFWMSTEDMKKGLCKKYVEGKRKLGPEMRAYLKKYHKLEGK